MALNFALTALLASVASAGEAALLHYLFHIDLVVDPLPFALLSFGGMLWLLLVCSGPPANTKVCVGNNLDWQSRVASKLESAARIIVGIVRTHGDQLDDVQQALTLLESIFVKTCKEGRPGANEAGTLAEHSVCALAAKFDALVLQIASYSTDVAGWVVRSVDAVEAALAIVSDVSPPTTANDTLNSKVAGALVTIQLLFIPVYCASVGKSPILSAFLALVAALVPAGLAAKHLCVGVEVLKRSPEQIESNEAINRRRIFSMRIMELRSLAESSAASTPEKNVVLSATRRDFRSCEVDIGYQILPQANKNEVASKLEQATQAEKLIIDTAKTDQKAKEAPIEASGQEQADEYDELESFEVPPFPLIDKREMVVTRAVLQSIGASAGAQATEQAPVQSGSQAHVLKDIGTLDHCATMMSFGSSTLTLSTLPIRQQQERKAGCYNGSTNQILSEVPRPDSGHFQAKQKWSTPPGLMPISGYRPTSSRPNSFHDALPDVSQMDLSQSTCFSLSPGDTVQNDTVQPSPGIYMPPYLDLQLDCRYEPLAPPVRLLREDLPSQSQSPSVSKNARQPSSILSMPTCSIEMDPLSQFCTTNWNMPRHSERTSAFC